MLVHGLVAHPFALAAPSGSDLTFGQAAILGIVQGLTEFLPISSTAHLRIVPALLGWPDPGAAFTAVIQLGTVTAVVLYFWRELLQVVAAWAVGVASWVFRNLDQSVRGTLEYRMGWYLILATIPVSVFGLIFSDQIETGARNLWLIAVVMIALAGALYLAERIGTRTRDEEQLNERDAIAVGGAQALALIPGASRSGTTITAGCSGVSTGRPPPGSPSCSRCLPLSCQVPTRLARSAIRPARGLVSRCSPRSSRSSWDSPPSHGSCDGWRGTARTCSSGTALWSAPC